MFFLITFTLRPMVGRAEVCRLLCRKERPGTNTFHPLAYGQLSGEEEFFPLEKQLASRK